MLLAFDTATPAVTVALLDDEAVVASRERIAPNRQGELLAPFIDEVLHEAGITARELDAIAVGRGPGPFTGLRVGIVTAATMGDALGIPVYAECSLDVIAAQLATPSDDGGTGIGQPYAVLSDARRKQVYWATYADGGARIDGPEISPPAELAPRWRGLIRPIAGAGALMYRDTFDGFEVVERAAYPQAGMLARLAASKLAERRPGDDLTPMYLRRPDAQPPGRSKQVTPA